MMIHLISTTPKPRQLLEIIKKLKRLVIYIICCFLLQYNCIPLDVFSRTDLLQTDILFWGKRCNDIIFTQLLCGRCGGLVVSVLDSGSIGPGLSPGQGHCVVSLDKTRYSHRVSLHPGV